jgi:hypothetical protein
MHTAHAPRSPGLLDSNASASDCDLALAAAAFYCNDDATVPTFCNGVRSFGSPQIGIGGGDTRLVRRSD